MTTTYAYSGYNQTVTVGTSGTYHITVNGASGGHGGLGYYGDGVSPRTAIMPSDRRSRAVEYVTPDGLATAICPSAEARKGSGVAARGVPLRRREHRPPDFLAAHGVASRSARSRGTRTTTCGGGWAIRHHSTITASLGSRGLIV